jgi:hypothetical protein
MELMQRTKVGLIRRQPQDWCEMLTADPTKPRNWTNYWLSILSGIAIMISLLALLFCVAVILIQPFLLLWHETPYPNLATVSFTTFLGALTLFLLSIIMATRLSINKRYVKRFLLIFLVLLVVLFATMFFFLISREAIWWTITKSGPAYIWNAIKDTWRLIIH